VILRLAEWVAGASDREKQREERRKDRMERRRAEAEGRMHRFADNQYMEQKEQVASSHRKFSTSFIGNKYRSY